MDHALVICIGNTARGDDGVGHEVARLLEAEGPAGAQVMRVADLDVTLAEEVAGAATLVLVDAERRERPAVEVRDLEPGTAGSSAHAVDAPGLLALAEALYGRAPRATIVTVAAPQMGHGSELSPTAKTAAVEAECAVRELLSRRAD